MYNLDKQTMRILKQAARDSVIYCPECGSSMEPDLEKCGDCGWINPLPKLGLI